MRALYHYGVPRSAGRVSASALSGATNVRSGLSWGLGLATQAFRKGLGLLLLYFMVKIGPDLLVTCQRAALESDAAWFHCSFAHPLLLIEAQVIHGGCGRRTQRRRPPRNRARKGSSPALAWLSGDCLRGWQDIITPLILGAGYTPALPHAITHRSNVPRYHCTHTRFTERSTKGHRPRKGVN